MFMIYWLKQFKQPLKVVLCDAGANDELLEWLESILGNEKVHIVETSKNRVTVSMLILTLLINNYRARQPL